MPEEAAVVAHKRVRGTIDRARRDFNIDNLRIGRVNLTLKNDGAICSVIAEDYDIETGARSINRAVKDHIEEPLVDGFLEEEELVSLEMNRRPREDWVAYLRNTASGEQEIIVAKGRDLSDEMDSLTLVSRNNVTSMW